MCLQPVPPSSKCEKGEIVFIGEHDVYSDGGTDLVLVVVVGHNGELVEVVASVEVDVVWIEVGFIAMLL